MAELAPSGPTMATVASASNTTVRGPPTRPPVRTSEAECQTDFTWPVSEKFPVRLAVNSTQTISRSTSTSEIGEDDQATPRQSYSGVHEHSDHRKSRRHSGGGSGRPKIQRPPSHPTDQALTSNRFAALQPMQIEGVEATDTAIT